MIARSRFPYQGFTLIELLVAISILALMSIMAYRGLAAIRDGDQHLAVVSERWQDIARGVERFGREVRQAGNQPWRGPDGRLLPAFHGQPLRPDRADEPQLSFSRLGNGDTETRRVGYRWRDGNLELLLWNTQGTQSRAYLILAEIRQFHLAYLNPQGVWSEHWPLPGMEGRPRAVRMTLHLKEGIRIERIFDLP